MTEQFNQFKMVKQSHRITAPIDAIPPLSSTDRTSDFWNTALFRQCLLSAALSLSFFGIGLVRGWSAPGLPSMRNRNPELLPSSDIESWAGSIPPLGAFCGSILSGPLMHYIGRKRTALATAPIWTLAWILIATTHNWQQLVAGRFLSGFGVGVTLPATQIYVSECTDPRTRGIIGSFPSLAMSAGILCAYVVGDLLDWQQSAWCGVAFSAALLFAVGTLPESPVWLDGRGRADAARQSRHWLRLPPTSGVDEKPATPVLSDSSSWRVLLTRPIWSPLLIGITLLTIQQVSGIDAVIFFTVNIFRASGSSIDGNVATIVVGVVQLASNALSLFVIDWAGRKPLLIASGTVMSVAMAFMGLAFHWQTNGNIQGHGYLPICSLIVFMVGFSIGFGSIPFVLMGEIFPAAQRGMLGSIATTFNLGAMFVVIKTYHDLEMFITAAGTFWLYSVCSGLGALFVLFCVPETKGRDLESMALVFRKSFRVLAGKSRNANGQEPSASLHGQNNEAFSATEITKC